MHKYNTRASTEQNKSNSRGINLNQPSTSGRGKSPLNISVREGRGRGRIPSTPRSSSVVSLASSESSTSLRAIRTSSVSRSLDSSTESNKTLLDRTNSNCDLLDNSLPYLSLDNLRYLTQKVDPSNIQTNLNESSIMATPGNVTNQTSQENPLQTSMETLMSFVRDTMRSTQDELRREIEEIKKNLGQPQENRTDHNSTGIHSQNSNLNSIVNSQASSSSFFIKLKDWNVSFSGDEDVSDFLFKIDTLTERSQCPLDYLMTNFHIFLKGKAESWFWTYIKQNPRATYPSLKRAITKQFSTLESNLDILMKMSTRKQYPKESYDDFHSSLVKMNLKLENPLDDNALIKIIRKNVKPELLNMTFTSKPNDLDSYRDLLREAESSLKSSSTFRQPNKPRHVDEISVESSLQSTNDDSDDDFDPQIETLKTSKQYVKEDYSKIKCWNCLKFGHSYIYCPENTRSLFFFKCGQSGVTTPECSNTHPGNRRRSEWATGDARSSK